MTPERTERLTKVLNKRQNNLAVVLENVFDPHNISAVMRSCDAVGIQDVYVLNTKIPRHKKWGAKSSSSAAKWLTIHQYTDAELCFKDLRQKYDKILATHLSSDAISLYEVDFTQSVALVFGNEHAGVSEEIRALADGNFIIPQVGIIQSLNISVACAVSIYEAYRQKKLAGHYDNINLPQEKYNTLLKEWGFTEEESENIRSLTPDPSPQCGEGCPNSNHADKIK
ncbi:RNA methyltransferase [Terrimonas sp.]|uniref:TrmH family RNA methyltransferase n=1 Tax=Terrimonas sp. TaxID=1914338 RepID=UPI000D51A272|nr:RNA methyltransferase [Terrimonas sp.]PVD50652.1 RNA methyltransferase [Terrimonas sp.]